MSIKPLATTAVGGRCNGMAGNANGRGARCAGSRPLRHYRDRGRAAPELQLHTSVLGAGGRGRGCPASASSGRIFSGGLSVAGDQRRSQPIIRSCPADDRVPIVRRQSTKKVWQLVADSIAGAGYPSCQAVGRMLAEIVIQPSSWYEKHGIHLIAGKRECGQAQRGQRDQQTDRRVVEV